MTFWIIIFSTLLSCIFGYLRHTFNYWKFIGIPQIDTNFLYGNLFKLTSVHHLEWIREVYRKFKGQSKVAGFYLFFKPIAVILDLDLVKSILIKDFDKFVDRTEYVNENDPLSENMFVAQSEKWKLLRTKLSPTFSSGKMKFMFPTIVEVGQEFKKAFAKHVDAHPNEPVEIHDFSARFTTDVIGSCVFGVESNSLEDPNNEFRRMGRRIFTPTFKYLKVQLLKTTYSHILKHFGFKRFDQDIEDSALNLVKKTVEFREKEHVKRNDFMNLLIEMRNTSATQGIPLTIERMAAQAHVFFVAGFETSSSNMSYCLFELAKHPDIQEKARAEIKEVLAKHNNELTYEAMTEMTYLEQVVLETLRMYPALAFIHRIAKEDYPIPGTNCTIQKGITCFIPAREIHYDPEIYENPTDFRPERFSPEEVKLRHPQAFLGFGDGPRNCIGLRFGKMQVRVGLIMLLSSFKFSVSNRTIDPIAFSKTSVILIPDKGVWLKAEKL